MTKVETLLEQYHKEYEFLYDADVNGRHVEGTRKAMSLGDELLNDRNPVVKELCQLMEDFILSDREVAAFGFAYSKVYGDGSVAHDW